ncbi:unnamed protein product [Amoebophrya sp. A25]|nr:unnamed protein product [Amoebophrya sp. A25]|eukprot:GSA25T00002934001.1
MVDFHNPSLLEGTRGEISFSSADTLKEAQDEQKISAFLEKLNKSLRYPISDEDEEEVLTLAMQVSYSQKDLLQILGKHPTLQRYTSALRNLPAASRLRKCLETHRAWKTYVKTMAEELPLSGLQWDACQEQLVGPDGLEALEIQKTKTEEYNRARALEIFGALADLNQKVERTTTQGKDFNHFHPAMLNLVAPSISHILKTEKSLMHCMKFVCDNREGLDRFMWLESFLKRKANKAIYKRWVQKMREAATENGKKILQIRDEAELHDEKEDIVDSEKLDESSEHGQKGFVVVKLGEYLIEQIFLIYIDPSRASKLRSALESQTGEIPNSRQRLLKGLIKKALFHETSERLKHSKTAFRCIYQVICKKKYNFSADWPWWSEIDVTEQVIKNWQPDAEEAARALRFEDDDEVEISAKRAKTSSSTSASSSSKDAPISATPFGSQRNSLITVAEANLMPPPVVPTRKMGGRPPRNTTTTNTKGKKDTPATSTAVLNEPTALQLHQKKQDFLEDFGIYGEVQGDRFFFKVPIWNLGMGLTKVDDEAMLSAVLTADAIVVEDRAKKTEYNEDTRADTLNVFTKLDKIDTALGLALTIESGQKIYERSCQAKRGLTYMYTNLPIEVRTLAIEEKECTKLSRWEHGPLFRVREYARVYDRILRPSIRSWTDLPRPYDLAVFQTLVVGLQVGQKDAAQSINVGYGAQLHSVLSEATPDIMLPFSCYLEHAIEKKALSVEEFVDDVPEDVLTDLRKLGAKAKAPIPPVLKQKVIEYTKIDYQNHLEDNMNVENFATGGGGAGKKKMAMKMKQAKKSAADGGAGDEDDDGEIGDPAKSRPGSTLCLEAVMAMGRAVSDVHDALLELKKVIKTASSKKKKDAGGRQYLRQFEVPKSWLLLTQLVCQLTVDNPETRSTAGLSMVRVMQTSIGKAIADLLVTRADLNLVKKAVDLIPGQQAKIDFLEKSHIKSVFQLYEPLRKYLIDYAKGEEREENVLDEADDDDDEGKTAAEIQRAMEMREVLEEQQDMEDPGF